jgi:hypothetical protein
MTRRRSNDSGGEEEQRPLPSPDQDGLSARMRELILRFKADDRRKSRQGDNGVEASAKRRRDTDKPG